MIDVTDQKPRRKSGFFYAREFLEESLPLRWVPKLYRHSPEDALDAMPRGSELYLHRRANRLSKKPIEKFGICKKTYYICSIRFGSVKCYYYISGVIKTYNHAKRRET